MRGLVLSLSLLSGCVLLTGVFRQDCGDGFLQRDEECDDGNASDGDGCSEGCLLEEPSLCGDGFLQPNLGEACDDGNQVNNDSCTNTCQVARCGDGVLRQDLAPGDPRFEQCDDGNDDPSDGCLDNCLLPCTLDTPGCECGDGELDAGEACDDGNNVDGDGCEKNCTSGSCENGTFDVGEVCFPTAQTLALTNTPSALLVRDIDQDGLVDIILLNSAQNKVSVLLDSGAGLLQEKSITTDVGPTAVAAENITGSPLLDLIVLSQGAASGGSLTVFTQETRGDFSQNQQLLVDQPVSLLVGDVDRNNEPDVLVGSSNGTLSLFTSDGGQLGAPLTVSLGAAPKSIHIGAFDVFDDQLEVLTLNEDGSASLLRRNGTGFDVTSISLGLTAAEVGAVADLNQDGLLDLALPSQDTIHTFLGDGRGGFSASITLAGGVGALTKIVVGDIEGDEDLDLLDIGATGARVLTPDLQGALTDEALLPISAPTDASFADLNRDGLLDIAAVQSANKELESLLFLR